MPLHLLSKKSWNVYNPAAIARVRADEAAAAAQEEAEDQRQEAYEAECRIARLRGLPIPDPPHRSPSPPAKRVREGGEKPDRSRQRNDDPRKRRRLHGEDDTDRDIRHAQQDQGKRQEDRTTHPRNGKEEDVPLTDHAGHIQLFAPPSTKDIRVAKDAEVEFKKRQQETFEDGALRFSDAAGFRKDAKERPWYADTRAYSGTEELDSKFTHGDDIGIGRDAFGNPDPSRAQRDGARMAATDPLAAMARAQKRLKEVEKERIDWQKNRERELKEIEALQVNIDRRRRRRDIDNPEALEDLDNFRLDDSQVSREEDHRSRHKSHHHESRRKHISDDKRSSREEEGRSRRHRPSRSRSPNRHDSRHERNRNDGDNHKRHRHDRS